MAVISYLSIFTTPVKLDRAKISEKRENKKLCFHKIASTAIVTSYDKSTP